METITKVLQVLLSISAVITLYVLAQFVAARMFKTRVEKLYLWFDFLFPFPSLLNFSLFKTTIAGTEYGLGWFPLGGYLQIAGMNRYPDEDNELLPPQPFEFAAKKRYQRYIILVSGVVVSLLLATFIYWLLAIKGKGPHQGISFFWPVTPLPVTWGWYSFGRLTAFFALLTAFSNTLMLPGALWSWR